MWKSKVHCAFVERSLSTRGASLILEPTRELAAQVAENFDLYGKYHNLTKALLIGGVTFNEQDKLKAHACLICKKYCWTVLFSKKERMPVMKFCVH